MDFAVDNDEGYPSNESSDDNEAQEIQDIASEETSDGTNAQEERPTHPPRAENPTGISREAKGGKGSHAKLSDTKARTSNAAFGQYEG